MKIQDKIIDIINKVYAGILTDNNVEDNVNTCVLEVPNNKDFGDFSTNLAMRSAGILKKAPMQIGEMFKKKLLADKNAKEFFSEIKLVNPGFINFYLKPESLLPYIKEIIEKKDLYGRSDIGNGKKVNIEFVSANPTGPLHVGHGRGAVLGDILANLYEFIGFDVTREYYVNDCGRQINILGNTVKKWINAIDENKDPVFEEQDENGEKKEWYKGAYMKEVVASIVEKYGKEHTVIEFGEYAGQLILENIKKDLSDFGVKEFDVWTSEKKFYSEDEVNKIIALLEDKDFIYEKDGAKWVKSSMFGDEKDRVVIRSNGEPTYLASDIAYHNEKITRGFDKLINIWGADHHGYVPRLKASITALKYDQNILDVILCQLVKLVRNNVPVQMSTRAGEFVTLKKVVDEVGRDTARFFFIMRKADAQLDFDLEIAKKHSLDNPVYYIQYAHARICSIFKHINENLTIQYDSKDSDKIDLNLLVSKEEQDLFKLMLNFQDVVENSALSNEPHRITVYLQELASCFHTFYNKHKVTSGEKELILARLFLVDTIRIVIKNGLFILGINALEEM
jgi:arginyl-tRNA synthetase